MYLLILGGSMSVYSWLLHAKISYFSLEIITWFRLNFDVAEDRFG